MSTRVALVSLTRALDLVNDKPDDEHMEAVSAMARSSSTKHLAIRVIDAGPATVSPELSLSVVSHGQGHMVRQLLSDLNRLRQHDFEVIVTINIDEPDFDMSGCDFSLQVIRNASPKGFGANHNAAFERSTGEFFVVVNPDIRAPELRLAELRKVFKDPRAGACAPLVLNSGGGIEESARRFPTLTRLLRRALLRERRPDYAWTGRPVSVDWVAGMFVMFRRAAFDEVGGFDSRRFFMYYEDVELCARLRRRGWTVWMQPSTRVIHDAQRASHHDLKHLRWHVTSALRYLTGL